MLISISKIRKNIVKVNGEKPMRIKANKIQIQLIQNQMMKSMFKRCIISILFSCMFCSSAFGQDKMLNQHFELTECTSMAFSANLFTLTANFDVDEMSLSYYGLSSPKPAMLNAIGTSSAFDLEDGFTTNKVDTNSFGTKFKALTEYIFQMFNMDNSENNAANENTFLKSKVDISKAYINDFEVNFALSMGYDENQNLKMDGIKVISYGLNTYLNAIYNNEKNEVELGLSNSYINQHLLDGMKLEFQANPKAGSGAVLLSMTL